jgi:hypothetical protein
MQKTIEIKRDSRRKFRLTITLVDSGTIAIHDKYVDGAGQDVDHVMWLDKKTLDRIHSLSKKFYENNPPTRKTGSVFTGNVTLRDIPRN